MPTEPSPAGLGGVPRSLTGVQVPSSAAAGHGLRIGVTVLALALAAVGLWALVDARSFFDAAARYPPYNAHLLHDIGAFVLGFGAILGAALVLADGLAVALAGATVASAAHAVAHVIDHDLGGKASDPYTFAALAVVFVALLLVRLRQLL